MCSPVSASGRMHFLRSRGVLDTTGLVHGGMNDTVIVAPRDRNSYEYTRSVPIDRFDSKSKVFDNRIDSVFYFYFFTIYFEYRNYDSC